MSELKGPVLYKKAGKLVPEALVRTMVAKANSLGVSVIGTEADKKTAKFIIDGLDKAPSLEQIQSVQKLYQAEEMLFKFGQLPAGYTEDDMQPFAVISGAKDSPLVVGFSDGDFTNYHEAKSVHTPDFFAFQKFFIPFIQKIYTKEGNSLEKLHKELNDPLMEQMILNSFKGRGNIVLHFFTGKILRFTNEKPQEYGWGWGTDLLGWKPKDASEDGGGEAPITAPAAAKKKSIFEQTQEEVAVAEVAEAATGPKSVDASEGPKPRTTRRVQSVQEEEAAADAAATKKADVASEAKVTILLKPTFPGILTPSKAQKKKWYEDNPVPGAKVVPEGYKECPPRFREVPVGELAEWLEKGWEVKGGSAKVTAAPRQEQGYPERLPDDKVEANRANKDVAPHHVTAGKDGKSVADVVNNKGGTKVTGGTEDPNVPKEQQEAVKGWFVEALKTKRIDINSIALDLDPVGLQSAEGRKKTATNQAGLDGVENVLGLSRAGLLDLCRTYPEWFVELFIEVRGTYIRTLKAAERPNSQSHVQEPKVTASLEEAEDDGIPKPRQRKKAA